MLYDNMTKEEVILWINKISKWSDGNTKVSLKIPSYKRYLKLTYEFNSLDFNVTGISDCVTALSAIYGNVKYISMIPGRMEEVGTNAKTHVYAIMNFLELSKK